MRKVGRHLRDQWAGFTALFLILCGGTAWAVDGPLAGQNTVGSEDIIGNEVKSDDIGNGRIFNLDIADEAITGQKIKNGTVSGADVSPSIGRVYDIDLSGQRGYQDNIVIHDLNLTFSCFTGSGFQLGFGNLNSQFATFNYMYASDRGAGDVIADGQFIGPGSSLSFAMGVGDFRIGQYIFSSPDSRITVDIYTFIGEDRCEANGTAVYSPTG